MTDEQRNPEDYVNPLEQTTGDFSGGDDPDPEEATEDLPDVGEIESVEMGEAWQ